jgi:hypothetical protein
MLGFEARAFDSPALVDTCAPGVNNLTCAAPSSFTRRDSYQRAEVQLTSVGPSIVALGYQLIVVDSNSYGEALVRHRITLSGTTRLVEKVYITGIATLQLDEYPDGLLVAADLAATMFTNLEDENRSSIQVRLGRHLTDAWSVEMRGAIWRDLGGGDAAMSTEFHRELLYGGVMYQR